MTVGRVTLVGAGPGAADLITLRGWRLLHEADVVVTDRLAGAEILAGLDQDVEIIRVGKSPGGVGATQEEINALLVDRARAGHAVVRLKGGDPFVFGRGGEEILACVAAGIPCDVVPGLSTATAVPALAGIPVTHRGVAMSFTVVSGHLPPEAPDNAVDWESLGRSGETVVLLMGVATLGAVAEVLQREGRDPATPVACVENGGLHDQRVLRATLATVEAVAQASGLRNPAVTVIGPVAALLPA